MSVESLVRIGVFNGFLERAVKRFSDKMLIVPTPLNNIQYASFNKLEKPYLIWISKQNNGEITFPGYNTILTITSFSYDLNIRLQNKFQRETGIKLDVEVPENLRVEYLSMMNRLFLSLFVKR